MARVVQRSSPPYLTIVFVFLFFIAAALAGLFYTTWRSAEEEADSVAERLNAIATPGELRDERMDAIRARSGPRSVVGQYRQDVTDLIIALVGPTEGADMSAAQALELVAAVDAEDGVLNQAVRLNSQLAAANERIDELQSRLERAQSDLTKQARDVAETERTLTQQLEAGRQQRAALQRQIEDLASSFQANIREANTDWQARVRELQSELATRQQENLALQERVTDLQREIEGVTRPEVSIRRRTPVLQADGQVLRVLEIDDDKVVYIDIGREHRVRPGLTFAVYSKRTGVSAEAQPKGAILVKSVSESTAECHVLRSQPGDPIVAGDLVANLAFSAIRRPEFMVDGRFDVSGDGQADPQGAEIIKAMITRFGGNVVDRITIQTDYVVLGMPPVVGPRPGPDAPPTNIAQWEENERRAQRYQQRAETATALNKPILNTQQFLTYVGLTRDALKP